MNNLLDDLIRAFESFQKARITFRLHEDPDWKAAHDAYWQARQDVLDFHTYGRVQR